MGFGSASASAYAKGEGMDRQPKPIHHGTEGGYCHHNCRCEACTKASRDARRRRRNPLHADRLAYEVAEQRRHALLSDLLDELFPFGLTDDCPARQAKVA